MQDLTRNRIVANKYIASLPLLALSWSTIARAATPECGADSTSLSCRLTGILHWLEAAAFVLGAVLIAVIVFAINLLRKNRISRKEGR